MRLIMIIPLLACLYCNLQNNTATQAGNKSETHKPEKIRVSVTPCIVSHGWADDRYYPAGEMFFSPDKAINGYRVQATKGKTILGTYYCEEKNVRHYVRLVRRLSQSQDSLDAIYGN
jgi:hypothetical protein